MNCKSIALCLFGLIILVRPSNAQNLLTDGSFETYQIKPGLALDPSAAKGYTGGWQFLGNAGLINASTGATLTGLSPSLSQVPVSPSGTQYAYLQTNRSGPSNNTTTNTDGIIYQAVNFTAVGNYTLTLSSRLVDSNSSGFNTTFTTYYMVEIDPQGQPGPNFKNIPVYSSPEIDTGGCQHAISDGGFNTSTLTFYIPTVGMHVIALVSGGPTIYTNSITLIDNISLTPAKLSPVAQLAITSVPQSMAVKVPSEEFDVQLENSNGLPTDATGSGVTLNLTDGVGGTFSLSAGGTPISSVHIPAGMHVASFFYQTSSAGTHTVSISNSAFSATATQVETVVDPSTISFIHQFIPPNSNPQNLHSNFLVDGNSSTPVVFHGLNLDGWLEMEGYEVPMDSGAGEKAGTGIADMYTVISTLDSRFGVATEQKLMNTYQVNWISDADIQNIHNAGLNIIRVPFWWANLYTLDHQWRPDAFTALDWVVSEAKKYNMKVLLDLHGTFGGESYNLWSGTANVNRYWESPYYQNKTDELWKRVATHFKYNDTVVGYDLINEPDGTPGNSTSTIQKTENRLYQDIRSIDNNHLIVVELTGGNWGWSNLQSPQSYGWSNVAYSTHLYGSSSQIPQEVRGFGGQTNVPDMVGESNLQFNNVDLVNALTTFNTTGPGISFLFWGYKEANNQGGWGLYDNGSLAYGPGGTGTCQSIGGYAGHLGIIPSLVQDSVQTIANDWASWTTAGTNPNGQYLNTYLPSNSCPAEFFVNYSIYDALSSVLQPAVALQEGLLTPSNPSTSNIVVGRNLGFQFPPIPPDTTGDHVGSDYIYRTNYSDSLNSIDAGWTFVTTGGDCGITGTGIKGGAISGATVPPIPLSETDSPEAFEGGLGMPPQPGQPSYGSPAQLNPATNPPPFNNPQLAYIKGTASFYQTVTSTETGPWQISYSSTLAPNSSNQPITVSVIPIVGSPSGSTTYTSPAVNPGSSSILGKTVTGTHFTTYTFNTPKFPAGSYKLQFSGTASGTALIDNVQIFVQQGPTPVITSPLSVIAYVNMPFQYTITASESPTAFEANLPAGFKMSASGTISGTPTQVGTYSVGISAQNSYGQGTTSTLQITVKTLIPTPTPTPIPTHTPSPTPTPTPRPTPTPVKILSAMTPVISLPSGTYNSPQTVSISCATTGAALHYTIDGTQPTALSALYTRPLLIANSVKLQVIAVASGLENSATAIAQYQITALALAIDYSGGFSSSPNLVMNGGASIAANALTLTDGGKNENRNAFFLKKVNVQNFTNNFTFQLTNSMADGFTFTFQGNSSSLSASEGDGGGLGYAGLPKSVAVKFDLYNNKGEGIDSTGIFENGAFPSTPAIDLTDKINLHSGDVVNVSMIYDGTTLAVTLIDTVTGQSFTSDYTVDIPSLVGGNSAYVGFTAGSGGLTATQKILTWTYLESVPSYLSNFTNGGLSLNGGASVVGPNLQLTTAQSNEARSAFYPIPINVASFTTSFVLQIEDPNADGMTFCIQNAGPNQLGTGGGGLGFAGIPKSVAIKFDLYNNQGEGANSTGLYANGAQPSVPAIDLTNSGINLHSGDPIQVDVSYDGKVLTVAETDSITGSSAQQQYTVDIPQLIGGNAAFIGFTAGTGGLNANQKILNWSF